MDIIAAEMAIDRLEPSWLGASMVLEGIPEFSHVPPGSRLQAQNGASIAVDMENLPCVLPARVIETMHGGAGKRFVPAARGRRGVTAWVEREGTVGVGDSLRLHVPAQPAWAHIHRVRINA